MVGDLGDHDLGVVGLADHGLTGSLREDLFAALDLLLRRAQQAGAVRAGTATSDLIVLLKGMFHGLTGSTDPAVPERVFAVLADGLRARG